MSFNKLTDDFELLEVVQEDGPSLQTPLTELDYLSLIAGARDYYYIMDKNKFRLDNEVTGLYPVASYQMLHFITFLVSQVDAQVNHLFDFKKNSTYGVYSTVFHDVLEDLTKKYPLPTTDYVNGHRIRNADEGFIYFSKDEKNIAYNLNNREFCELRLTKHTRFKNSKPDEKLSKLYNNQEMLYILKYPLKMRYRRAGDLSAHFKREVMLYLPRFYFNVYSRYHEMTKKTASINQLKIMSDSTLSLSEYSNNSITLSNPLFGGIEKQKMYLSMGLDELQALEFLKNINLGYEDFKSMMTGDKREMPITDIYELHEFMIKSILVRRPPTSLLNTKLNRTNGVYLLNKGVSRFRNIVLREIFRHANFGYIHVNDRFVAIRFSSSRKKKIIPFKEIVDFNNKPYLLNARFIDLINRVYDKYPVHRLLKFAEIYMRLFNQFGNNVIWFLLGTELGYFNYARFLDMENTDASLGFKKFEELLFGAFNKRKNKQKYPPKGRLFKQTAKKLAATNYYPRKLDYLNSKFKISPDCQQKYP